jgi:hypothetical protein
MVEEIFRQPDCLLRPDHAKVEMEHGHAEVMQAKIQTMFRDVVSLRLDPGGTAR